MEEEQVGKGRPLPKEILLAGENKGNTIAAFTILARKQNQPLDESDFQCLLRLCICQNFETIWRIVYGVSAYDFEAAGKWLEYIVKPFTFVYGEQAKEELKIFPKYEPYEYEHAIRFFCGVIAGILKIQSSVNIIDVLATIIASCNYLTDAACTHFDYGRYGKEKATNELKGTLVNLIHERIKIENDPLQEDSIKPLKFFEKLGKKINELSGPDKYISNVGQFIMNQICQAVFSSQSTQDKIKALDLLLASKK